MYRLIYLVFTLNTVLFVVSCTGGRQVAADDESQSTAADSTDTVAEANAAPVLLHNGMSDTIFRVVTEVFAAKQEGNEVVKDGKPDYYREFNAFPNEDTCQYDTMGRLDQVRGVSDGMRYRYVYGYEGNTLCEEQYYQDDELFYDRQYIYNPEGQRINTVEQLFIAGSKTINEYPIDPSRIMYKDGNKIEFGDTYNDYTITDPRGNVIEESSYSEMDDYSSVIEYSYNDRGWRISINCDGEYLYTYDYTNIDTHGNWTRAVIRCNGTSYGIVERTITYY